MLEYREKFMNGSHKIFPHISLMIIVIFSYAYFAISSMNVKSFSKIPDGHYQYLTESFLKGHTYFIKAPPKALLALKNPYDYQQNYKILLPDGNPLHARFHDVSLYANKFYLYFGPLPVITFYIPCKLLTGFYPPDCFAVFLFLSIGFIICYGLLNKIQQEYFPNVKPEMMFFCGLVLGFANNAPFLLLRPDVYEVAIASAFCFLSAAVFFLYRIFYYRFKFIDILLFSTMLGLSIAGRPHFALIAMVVLPFIIFYILTQSQFNFWKLFAFSPIAIIIAMLLAYNQIRFHSMFEFGQAYQLIFDTHGLSAQLKYFDFPNMAFNFKEGFYNYFLRPFAVFNSFPYVFFPDLLIERVAHDNIYEGSFGLFKTSPFIILILLLPLQNILYYKKINYQPLFSFITYLMLMSFIIILFLISLNSTTQRYLSDFSTYLIMLAILSVWISGNHFKDNLLSFIKVFFIISGIFSIYVGIILAKSFIFVGMYFRNVDLSFINYSIFFSSIMIQAFFFFWIMKRDRRYGHFKR